MNYLQLLSTEQKFILLLCFVCFFYSVYGIVDGFLSENVKSYMLGLLSAAAAITIAAMTFTNATTTLSIDTVAAYLDENKSDMTINGISLEHSEIYYNHGRIYIELDQASTCRASRKKKQKEKKKHAYE